MAGRSKALFWAFLALLLVAGGVIGVRTHPPSVPPASGVGSSTPVPPFSVAASPIPARPLGKPGVSDGVAPIAAARPVSPEGVLDRLLEGRLGVDAANELLAVLCEERMTTALSVLTREEGEAFRKRRAPAGFFLMGPGGRWAVVRDGNGDVIQIGLPGRPPSEGGIPEGVPMDAVITMP